MKTHPPRSRRRRALAALTALASSTSFLLLSTEGADADAGDQQFSGWVRNYSAFVGPEILDTINARANIGEAIAVADSGGLSSYAGTGTGDLAVPGQIATDPTSRSYGRSAPVGVGFTGLNVQPVNAQSASTTIVDAPAVDQDFGDVDLSPVGKLTAVTGAADSNWNPAVLSAGGRLAYSDSDIANLELLGTLPVTVPGLPLPLASAELGQNTSEVTLAPDTAACATGLAVRSEATWDFADVHLFDGFVDVSWGGDAGGTADSATMVASANGTPTGATLTVSELPDMTVNAGTWSVALEPGATIELGEIFDNAGGPLGTTLRTLVDGEISYEGVSDIQESPDGTWAHGSLNGLNANLSLLPVPIIAPNGLGSAELGIMRGEVDAKAPAGGLNCESTSTDPTATDPTATDPTATDPTATDPTATDPTATDPTATDPTATDPTATDPTATDPTATDPTATDPTATDPTATDPTATDPTATDPTATDPTATDPTATDPTATDPTATDPTATDPTATDPTATDPTATDPTATDPTATDPTATDPDSTDPTAPGQGDPDATNPDAKGSTDPSAVAGDAAVDTDGASGSGSSSDGGGSAAGGSAAGGSSDGSLPDTGGFSAGWMAAGLGLLLLGAVVTGGAVRRHRA